MKKLLYFLLAITAFAACKKSKTEFSRKSASELAGKWKLTETRTDPGDGSGRWRPVDPGINIVIEFGKDGSFKSNETGNQFNRYTVNGDSATLFNSLNSSIKMPVAIQELNTLELSYYFGWPWCGGPSGKKYVRF